MSQDFLGARGVGVVHHPDLGLAFRRGKFAHRGGEILIPDQHAYARRLEQVFRVVNDLLVIRAENPFH
jgi:hypothetical protein